MRSGRYVQLAGALLAPALILGGVVPRVSLATSGSVVHAGDILFDDDHTGTAYVEIRDASTGSIQTLTTGYTPAMSPDGRKIAFVTAAGDGSGSQTLHVMNANGSGIAELVPRDMNSHDNGTASTQDGYPHWSRDGKWIAFDRTVNRGTYGNYYEIDSVRADGTGLSTVVSSVQTSSSLNIDQFPTWSPTKDATGNYRIAFSNFTPATGYHIYIVDADGSHLHPVSTVQTFGGNAVSANVPNWSPDGSRIYFLQVTGTEPIDYYSSSDGFTSSDATISQLQADTTAQSLDLSADGSTLIFQSFCIGCTVGVETLSTDGTGSPVPLPNSLHEDDPSLVPAITTIVGLGDSVAAGEGINYGFIWTGTGWLRTVPGKPTWMDTTSALGANYQQCHQSGRGYPNLIARNEGNYRVYNMACTGASALQNNTFTKPEDGGVLDPEQFNSKDQPYPENPGPSDPSQAVPAELGGVRNCSECSPMNKYFSKHNPSIVLLTMGANDVNFPYWLNQCYDPRHRACNKTTNTDLLNRQLRIEKSDLATTLSQLDAWAAAKGKPLRVLVTNYYDPFNPNLTNCIDYNVPIGGIGITGSELAWLENGLINLNANIAADVKQAHASDTHLNTSLVDLSNVMSGHQWCSQDPWVYGASIDFPVVGDSILPGHNPAPFHPTPEGQNRIYEAVNAVLNSPT